MLSSTAASPGCGCWMRVWCAQRKDVAMHRTAGQTSLAAGHGRRARGVNGMGLILGIHVSQAFELFTL